MPFAPCEQLLTTQYWPEGQPAVPQGPAPAEELAELVALEDDALVLDVLELLAPPPAPVSNAWPHPTTIPTELAAARAQVAITGVRFRRR